MFSALCDRRGLAFHTAVKKKNLVEPPPPPAAVNRRKVLKKAKKRLFCMIEFEIPFRYGWNLQFNCELTYIMYFIKIDVVPPRCQSPSEPTSPPQKIWHRHPKVASSAVILKNRHIYRLLCRRRIFFNSTRKSNHLRSQNTQNIPSKFRQSWVMNFLKRPYH